MSDNVRNERQTGASTRRDRAAAWVARLERDGLSEDEAVAFDAWLEADPRNAESFDHVLAVSHAYAQAGRDVAAALDAAPTRVVPFPVKVAALAQPSDGRLGRRAFLGAGGLAAAAAVALIAGPALLNAPTAVVYETGRGERRRLTLDDGTTLDLNADTRLVVALGRTQRNVTLDRGQAVFDVTHDPRRPFLIAAGDRTVRVVGTRFDVLRRDGRLAVTVDRGAVEVRPTDAAGGRAYRLRPGQRLEHAEGAAQMQVAAADPKEVLGWRSGRMVYRGAPLSQVVADLNRQFLTPVTLGDPSLADLPISGVLILDDQSAVIRRLALLVPVRAVRSDAGVVLRRERVSSR